jgi:hypothetical protein
MAACLESPLARGQGQPESSEPGCFHHSRKVIVTFDLVLLLSSVGGMIFTSQRLALLSFLPEDLHFLVFCHDRFAFHQLFTVLAFSESNCFFISGIKMPM